MATKKTFPATADRALLDKIVGKVKAAQRHYATFTQEHDSILRAKRNFIDE